MKHLPDPPEPAEPTADDERMQGAERKEGKIDQALADSFPASDAPPWTLGIGTPPSVTPTRKQRRR